MRKQVTLFVCGVFLRHNDTPVVRASGRELSYVLLLGILLCYLVTFTLVLKPTNVVCSIQRFAAGFCFTVVYAALLTKTNRISRIFRAGSAKRPSFISPRSQLIICCGLIFVQILINAIWMIIDPARAMHHYPMMEDNLLVCNNYIDASYMIAFAFPTVLIVVCTVYAILTRKIPEAFNESKHIGLTMYTTCVIWCAFVPLYYGTGSNIALRITSMSVTISLSASVTLICLFSPKVDHLNLRIRKLNIKASTWKALMFKVTMEKSKIRVIYEYEFRRGTTVSETARNINAVFGEGSTTKATVGNWFKNFRDGDFSLANEPRGRPKTKVDNDHLRAVVEFDPSQSTRELASIFNVSIPTILVPLAAIDLSPTDYHFFRNLDNFLVGKFFNSQQAVESAFRDFIDSRTPGFYSRGIDQLPLKWQKLRIGAEGSEERETAGNVHLAIDAND
ncbi:hypothetical protein DMN91_012487 [Ooceraea biroi]|uniref:G-protein coupled receptors family 3 profile domain-containing protein n=1 Tax=Ooceraea biroi TaxID=2015173 RepID=A0A3L8D646_OOCBI|nr:hypothetical protein DMN91_012487 [Ooceraea biroi]